RVGLAVRELLADRVALLLVDPDLRRPAPDGAEPERVARACLDALPIGEPVVARLPREGREARLELVARRLVERHHGDLTEVRLDDRADGAADQGVGLPAPGAGDQVQGTTAGLNPLDDGALLGRERRPPVL